jgi:hypothetical protein
MRRRRESIKRLETRARRIAAALQKLDADRRCSATAMRLALAPDEWEGYSRRAWLCIPVLTGGDATEFRRYKACLTRADCLRDRAMKLPTVGWQALKQDRLARMAQREYGDAWEILEQLLRYQNPVVEMLLDRPFEGSSSEPEDIPRPWDSQHELALGDAGARLREFAELQRTTLRESLMCIEAQPMAGAAEGGRVDIQPAGGRANSFAEFDVASDLGLTDPFADDSAFGLLPRFREGFGPLL